MAMNNLKDFNLEWITFGLLFFCMMTFTLLFMAGNNEEGLLDSSGNDISGKFSDYQSEMSNTLIETEEDSNSLLNITAQNNPEESFLGSKDSVPTSYGTLSSAKKFFSQTKLFLNWMLAGTTGSILISVFVGMFGFTALYFITKWIRQGG